MTCAALMLFMIFAESTLEQLIEENERLRLSSVAESTLKNRRLQWRCYLRFCAKYSLPVLPCTNSQAALYATFLSQYMVALSITTYIQAVIFFHNIHSHQPPNWKDFNLKSTLTGIRNTQTKPSNQKDPLFPKHLAKMSRFVDKDNAVEKLVWAAVCFLFRTLLRVSHVVISPHTLKTKDVVFTNWGLFVVIHSSKTKKKHHKPQYIPVVSAPSSPICPVTMLRDIWVASSCGEDNWFSITEIPAISYGTFHKTLDDLIKKSGLPGSFSSHSLRRGGASFMSMIDCTIPQIKSRGNWSSDCVYDYVVPSMGHELAVDTKFSSFYSQFR